jgi:RNA polymerase sigma factor (sigma-70 family)
VLFLEERREVTIDLINEDNLEEIIEEIMVTYGTELTMLAYSYVKDVNTAKNIVQNVFIKCYYNLLKYKGESSLKTWLYRITINQCKDYLRSAYFRKIKFFGRKESGEQNSTHFFDSIFKFIGDTELRKAKEESTAADIDQQIMNDGVKMHIREAVYVVRDFQLVMKLNATPIHFQLGELGNVEIIDVNREDNATVIKYKLKSDFPFLNADHFVLKDDQGNRYSGIERNREYLGNQTYMIEEVFLNTPDENLSIEYHKEKAPEVLKDLEVEVPLK